MSQGENTYPFQVNAGEWKDRETRVRPTCPNCQSEMRMKERSFQFKTPPTSLGEYILWVCPRCESV